MKKLNAFTLAEVLITLGIIGVVAAMTLPTLIQNHQKQVYATQLKKSINVFENMLNKMKADEGVTELGQIELFSKAFCQNWQCEGFSGSNYANLPFAEQAVAKYLKTVKTCKNRECTLTYLNGDYEQSNLICRAPANAASLSKIGFYSTDGSIYYLAAYSWFAPLVLIIDINGEKGPNTYGRDVFSFNQNTETFNNTKLQAADDCTKRLLENNFTMDY